MPQSKARKLYGFMQDEKWWEDCLHILLGLIPMAGWIKEHVQWPPGKPGMSFNTHEEGYEMVTQLDRVADAYRDFLGDAIGQALRCAILVGLLVWKW